jgi:TolA-binding protein
LAFGLALGASLHGSWARAYPPAEPALGEIPVTVIHKAVEDPRLRIALDALLRRQPAAAAPILSAYLAAAPADDVERRPALLLSALAHLALRDHAAFHAEAEELAMTGDTLAALARGLLVFDHLDRGELELAARAAGDAAAAEETAVALRASGLEAAYRLSLAILWAARGESQASAAIAEQAAADAELGPAARALAQALAQAPGLAPAEAAFADTLRSAEAALKDGAPEIAAPRFATVAADAHRLAAGLDGELRARTLTELSPADLARLLCPVGDRSPEAPRLGLRADEVSTRVLGAVLAELKLPGTDRTAAVRPSPMLVSAEVLAAPGHESAATPATPALVAPLVAPAPLSAAEATQVARTLEELAIAVGRLDRAQRIARERSERAAALADARRRLEEARATEAANLAGAQAEIAQAFAQTEAARQALGEAVSAATARAEGHVDSLMERGRVLKAAARGLVVLYPAPEPGARPEPPPLAIDRRTALVDERNLAILDSTWARARAALPKLVAARVRGERWPAVERQLAIADSLADQVARLSEPFGPDPEGLLPPDPAAEIAAAEIAAAQAAAEVRSALLTADQAATGRARDRLRLLAEASRFGYAEALFQVARQEGPVPPASVTADGPPTLAELALRAAAIAYETFVAAEPEGPGAPAAWIRVGELRQELAEIDFRRAMVRHEADRERGLATGPLPMRDMAGPAAAARTFLERFPQHPRADRALYNLAVLARDQGDLAQSTTHFTRLRTEHPESPLALEAALRIGDNHFAADNYAAAETAFALVIADPGPLGTAALYKLGWCRMNSEQTAGAAEAFGTLLERDLDPEVRADAGKTLARCLADLGGPPAAEGYFVTRPGAAYAPAIFHSLSQELANRSDYAGAVDAARLGAARHPDAPELENLLADEITAFDRADQPAEAARSRLRYAQALGPGTPWFQAHGSDSLATRTAATMLDGADQLMLLAADDDSAAKSSAHPSEAGRSSAGRGSASRPSVPLPAGPATTYGDAHAAYRLYLARFPAGPARDRAELMAAECEMNLGNPRAAADSYGRVAATTADTARARIAAYGAVVAWAEARGPATAGAAELDGEITAIDHFVRYFSDDSRVPEALLRRGAIAHQAGRCDAALASYEMLVTLHPRSPHRIQARRAQGDVALKCDRPAEAAATYSALLAEAPRDLTPADSALVAEARGLLPIASFQAAEALAKAGKPGPAAAAYADVAERFPDFGSADLALLRAGDAARAAGDRRAAAAHYGTLADRYGQSANRAPALLRRGELAAEAGDSAAAAREYLRFAGDYPQAPEAEAAFTTARGLARSAHDWELVDQAARAELGWRGQAATGSGATTGAGATTGSGAAISGSTLPARLDLVESLIGRGRTTDARTELDRMFPRDAAPAAENELSARAHLLRAELALPSYEQLAIAPPIAPAIERKKGALTAVLADLDPAARHGEPPDALAARDLLGGALAEFGRALVEAETPPDLEGEDLIAYSQGVATQADAFYRRAEAAWRDALTQAEASGLAAHPRAAEVRQKLFVRYDLRYAELTRARLPDPAPAPAPALALHPAGGSATRAAVSD